MMASLWTSQDEIEALALLEAAQNDDLIGAMLAIEGPSETRARWCRQLLDRWAARVRDALGGQPLGGQLLALRKVMVDDLGLQGEEGDYYHPRNSHLSAVLERRRGLPISLCAVWLAVCQHAGLDAEGVGMPGHFIIKVEEQLLDPFHGGRTLTEAQCAELCKQITAGKLRWKKSYLDPTPTSAIIERMLRNLIAANARRGISDRLYRVVRLMATLNPNANNELMHARVSEEVGALRLSLELYQSVAAEHNGTQQGKIAAMRIPMIQNKLARLN